MMQTPQTHQPTHWRKALDLRQPFLPSEPTVLDQSESADFFSKTDVAVGHMCPISRLGDTVTKNIAQTNGLNIQDIESIGLTECFVFFF